MKQILNLKNFKFNLQLVNKILPWFFVSIVIIISDIIIFFEQSDLYRYTFNGDVYVYLYQAYLFSDGLLKFTIPEEFAKFFSFWFYVKDGTEYYSKYLPGFAFSLVPWVKLNIPIWTYPVFINTLFIFFTAKILRILTKNIRALAITVLLVAFCPTLLFMNGLLLSYSFFALQILIAAYLVIRYLQIDKIRYLALASFFLGYAFATRPYEAMLIYAIFGLFFFFREIYVQKNIRKNYRKNTNKSQQTTTSPSDLFIQSYKKFLKNLALRTLAFVLPFFILAVLLLIYNHQLTGGFLTTPFQKFCPDDTIGFGKRAMICGHPDNYMDYTFEVAQEKTKTIFRKAFLPYVFGNLELGMIALTLALFYVFSKRKFVLYFFLATIIIGFVADFFHWVFSLDFWILSGGYGYLLFILPFLFILFALAVVQYKNWVTILMSTFFIFLMFWGNYNVYQARYQELHNFSKPWYALGTLFEKNPIPENSILFIDHTQMGQAGFLLMETEPMKSDIIYAMNLGPMNQELMEAFPEKNYYLLKNGVVTPIDEKFEYIE